MNYTGNTSGLFQAGEIVRGGTSGAIRRHGCLHLFRHLRADVPVRRPGHFRQRRGADRQPRGHRRGQRHAHPGHGRPKEQRLEQSGDGQFQRVGPRGGLHLRRRPLRDHVPRGQHRQGPDAFGLQAVQVQPVSVRARMSGRSAARPASPTTRAAAGCGSTTAPAATRPRPTRSTTSSSISSG
ncbi:MAG: hypothetical protein MZV70_28935 [Desulfobacterales bacterium]|nr:hypothetical protein [Desulfobacterales bacterium]